MSAPLDVSQLARRDESRRASADTVGPPRHVLARWVLPGGLLVGFCALLLYSGRELLVRPLDVTVVPVLVTHSAVAQSGTPLFRAAGWVEPRPTPLRVAALSGGVVDQLLVVEDQPVEAGQPIAQLIDEDARLVLAAAEAQLRTRQSELRQAQAELAAARTRFEEPVHLQAPLAEAHAMLAAIDTQLTNLPFQVRRARAELLFARQNVEGKTSATDAVSGRLIQRAQSDLEAAQARLEELLAQDQRLQDQRDALHRRCKALERQLELKVDEQQAVEVGAAKVALAEARLEAAQVAVAEAKLALDRMTVRAPVAGRVLELVAYPGTQVSGMSRDVVHDGSTVVTLYQPGKLQVRTDVRFEDLPRVQRGQPVLIESPAVPEPIPGRVLLYTALADIQKNTLDVKVVIDDPPEILKPEMLVQVTFLAPETDSSQSPPGEALRMYIPQALVIPGEDGTAVWVADQTAGMARRQPVVLGAAAAELVEVVSGLSPASRLIVSPRESLEEGTAIRVVGEDASLGVGAGLPTASTAPTPASDHPSH